jgi:CRISPR-associated protein Cas2
MVVVVLTDCPVKLRGDLSKWLFEINTGVYVGNL